MVIAHLSEQEAKSTPYRIWNEFVHLLALHEYQEFSSEQRPAHLVFWYESEVLNGSHFQYFVNRGAKHLEETVNALGLLEATCQQRILREAGEFFLAHPQSPIDTVDDYIAAARTDPFTRFDERFSNCTPSLHDCLQRYLQDHQSVFIRIR